MSAERGRKRGRDERRTGNHLTLSPNSADAETQRRNSFTIDMS
jgi:hypothetical protein